MTPSEIAIAKRILNALHELDGGQSHALTIHGEIGGLSACTTRDFDGVLTQLDRDKHISGVHTKYKGVLWSITDLGEAARTQMP